VAQTIVERRRLTGIRLADDADASPVSGQHLGRIVGRSIIHDDDFVDGSRLAQDRIQALDNQSGAVEGRYDRTDTGHGAFYPNSVVRERVASRAVPGMRRSSPPPTDQAAIVAPQHGPGMGSVILVAGRPRIRRLRARAIPLTIPATKLPVPPRPRSAVSDPAALRLVSLPFAGPDAARD
jgi:hypothetical protein